MPRATLNCEECAHTLSSITCEVDLCLLTVCWSLGPIITTAGALMVITFSTLLASHELVLRQIGFVAAVAALIDTMVVRTLLVPCLMLLGGERWAWLLWWPV